MPSKTTVDSAATGRTLQRAGSLARRVLRFQENLKNEPVYRFTANDYVLAGDGTQSTKANEEHLADFYDKEKGLEATQTAPAPPRPSLSPRDARTEPVRVLPPDTPPRQSSRQPNPSWTSRDDNITSPPPKGAEIPPRPLSPRPPLCIAPTPPRGIPNPPIPTPLSPQTTVRERASLASEGPRRPPPSPWWRMCCCSSAGHEV